jgi:hypothetical protein
MEEDEKKITNMRGRENAKPKTRIEEPTRK